MTTPNPRATRLHNLARTLQLTTHREAHADCGICPRCRAQTWSTTGYPTGTLGDGTGSRTSDSTSSTERHALTNHPAPTHLARWDAALAALDTATITLHNLLVELGYDPTNPHKPATLDDTLPVGRGTCLACGRLCLGDGDTDRLKAGLCHNDYTRCQRWRRDDPTRTVGDYIRHLATIPA